MRYLQRLNPAGGIADFWHEIRRPQPYRWLIWLLSLAASGSILYAITRGETFVPPPKPKVSYITTFAPGRSEAEIVRSNLENERRKAALEAEREERERSAREAYATLGSATGVDTSAAVAEGEAMRRAAREAERARLRELFDENGRTRAPIARDPAAQ